MNRKAAKANQKADKLQFKAMGVAQRAAKLSSKPGRGSSRVMGGKALAALRLKASNAAMSAKQAAETLQ